MVSELEAGIGGMQEKERKEGRKERKKERQRDRETERQRERERERFVSTNRSRVVAFRKKTRDVI